MHLRKPLFQSGAQIEEILKRQIGMKSANDVKLGDSFGISRSGSFESFIERHGIGAGRVLLASEGTKAASGYADVGGINVAVDAATPHFPQPPPTATEVAPPDAHKVYR